MGTTTNYQIPYPELTDPPDGATQMKALADKVDAIVKSLSDIAKGKEVWTTIGNFVFANSQTSGNITVTFPASRFTAAPTPTGTGQAAMLILRATAITAASATMSAWCISSLNGTYPAAMAFINSPTAAPTAREVDSDPPLDDEGRPARALVAQCQTPDCENENADIPIWSWPDDHVVCGPCGQAITHVR